MYGKLYYHIYKYLENKRNFDSTFNSACLVFITQLIHILLFFSILNNFFGIRLNSMSDSNFDNKLLFFPIGAIWLILVDLFFKRRLDIYNKKYSNSKTLNKRMFIFMLIVVLFIPLYITIRLSGGVLWK